MAGRIARHLPARAPRPGAQLSLSDADGHRFQLVLTNQAGDPVRPEARRRARARVEDAIRAAKDTGLGNLPFRALAPNAARLEPVLIAQDLTSWAQALLLDGELARVEPKRPRHRLLHVAGRITRSGRRLRLHLPERRPWAGALAAAFRRLGALPAPGWIAGGTGAGEDWPSGAPRAAWKRLQACDQGAPADGDDKARDP